MMDTWIETSIDMEIARAKGLYPEWPVDPVHAAAVVAEEAGELVKACLDFCYGPERDDRDMRVEAVQVGAMAVRFLMGIGRYQRVQYPSNDRIEK